MPSNLKVSRTAPVAPAPFTEPVASSPATDAPASGGAHSLGAMSILPTHNAPTQNVAPIQKRGSGKALPAKVRAQMEGAFGTDFRACAFIKVKTRPVLALWLTLRGTTFTSRPANTIRIRVRDKNFSGTNSPMSCSNVKTACRCVRWAGCRSTTTRIWKKKPMCWARVPPIFAPAPVVAPAPAVAPAKAAAPVGNVAQGSFASLPVLSPVQMKGGGIFGSMFGGSKKKKTIPLPNQTVTDQYLDHKKTQDGIAGGAINQVDLVHYKNLRTVSAKVISKKISKRDGPEMRRRILV